MFCYRDEWLKMTEVLSIYFDTENEVRLELKKEQLLLRYSVFVAMMNVAMHRSFPLSFTTVILTAVR